ncbi:hypothetical protein ACJW30_04G162100 [Castanea mollissima]
MGLCILSLLNLFAFLIFTSVHARGVRGPNKYSFKRNYNVTWGLNNALLLNQETEVQLSMDQKSGSGFESYNHYKSGLFHMRIKVPEKNSIGIVTAFYLSSPRSAVNDKHDELDFEFLGSNGPPYTLQTNVFVNGQGGREQKIKLWFNPTKHFHSYKILWNQFRVVFYVDDIPIRVFKNNAKLGVSYPSKPMRVIGSLWNPESWASNGIKTDWSQAPFKAKFQDFNIHGCTLQTRGNKNCHSSKLWWNGKKYQSLNVREQRAYQNVRRKYITYDYCSDRSRHPKTPPECRRKK